MRLRYLSLTLRFLFPYTQNVMFLGRCSWSVGQPALRSVGRSSPCSAQCSVWWSASAHTGPCWTSLQGDVWKSALMVGSAPLSVCSSPLLLPLPPSPFLLSLFHSKEIHVNDLLVPFLTVAAIAAKSASDVCTLESDAGPCRAAFTRFYYNTETSQCEQFIYGGCMGNGNNFKSLQECQKICMCKYYTAPTLNT